MFSKVRRLWHLWPMAIQNLFEGLGLRAHLRDSMQELKRIQQGLLTSPKLLMTGGSCTFEFIGKTSRKKPRKTPKLQGKSWFSRVFSWSFFSCKGSKSWSLSRKTAWSQDHYATMDAPRDATVAELRRCYLKASVLVHPDKTPGSGTWGALGFGNCWDVYYFFLLSCCFRGGWHFLGPESTRGENKLCLNNGWNNTTICRDHQKKQMLQ